VTLAALPRHKTKIICTIGPACDSPAMLARMIGAGMNVARLNFSHGDFDSHREVIARLRRASEEAGRRLAIMADLPGPKIRVGRVSPEPVELRRGEAIILTTDEVEGDASRVSVNFDRLPQVVKQGDALFLNDGLIELEVEGVEAADVRCRVQAGGELSSRKGLNLPGIDLGMSAFTDRDRECLDFALAEGVDAVSQSFVGEADDLLRLRDHAATLGHSPFVIAKIERAGALKRIDEIIASADGIMIARGDLGVEVPIEKMALIQKDLMVKAILRGRPVITATQMLESMTSSRRPTRAEATDVANAVLDGTDCVMLSGESAMGRYPVEAVEMLARIAAEAEPHRPGYRRREAMEAFGRDGSASPGDLTAWSAAGTVDRSDAAVVVVPTLSGATARNVSRFRLPVWVAALSPSEETCRHLQFSYGVHPVLELRHPEDWKAYIREGVQGAGLEGSLALLIEGPSRGNPEANHRMELIELQE
jgi:pyruvate kinase